MEYTMCYTDEKINGVYTMMMLEPKEFVAIENFDMYIAENFGSEMCEEQLIELQCIAWEQPKEYGLEKVYGAFSHRLIGYKKIN